MGKQNEVIVGVALYIDGDGSFERQKRLSVQNPFAVEQERYSIAVFLFVVANPNFDAFALNTHVVALKNGSSAQFVGYFSFGIGDVYVAQFGRQFGVVERYRVLGGY